MRKQFKIMYPQDHTDAEKRGKSYLPPASCMVVMSNSGCFFLYNGEPFYPSIRKLSDVLHKYDVVWK